MILNPVFYIGNHTLLSLRNPKKLFCKKFKKSSYGLISYSTATLIFFNHTISPMSNTITSRSLKSCSLFNTEQTHTGDVSPRRSFNVKLLL